MTERFLDMTGEIVGTYRGVEKTEHRDAAGTTLWLFRCTLAGCERTRFFSAGEARRYQREGTRPRCYCPGYRELLKRVGVVHPKRCGLCKSVDHAVAKCPSRKPSRWCEICAGLSHRVRGIKCRECGLRFRHEAPVALVVDGLSSSAGLALAHAIGGDKDDAVYRRPRRTRAA